MGRKQNWWFLSFVSQFKDVFLQNILLFATHYWTIGLYKMKVTVLPYIALDEVHMFIFPSPITITTRVMYEILN